jgi:RNA recognition motif. (a.k.a. RRM, RBD, or RNP domain)
MDTLPLEDAEVNIFVGNLAFTTTEQDLRQLFEPYGTIETIRIMLDRDTGRSLLAPLPQGHRVCPVGCGPAWSRTLSSAGVEHAGRSAATPPRRNATRLG